MGGRFRPLFRKRYFLGRISEAMRLGYPIREGCFVSGADFATADDRLVTAMQRSAAQCPLPRVVDASRLLADDLTRENLSARMGRIRWVLLWFFELFRAR